MRLALVAMMTTAITTASAEDAATLLAQWRKDPANHPNIPDVSWAGYQRGERPLPEPAVVTSVSDHGAKANDEGDDTAAFAAAIAAAAAKGGGAVLVPAGRWHLDGIIRLTADHVVLRGEGVGKTVLDFRRPLKDVLGNLPHERLTQWSWSGGLVWMSPANAFDAGGAIAGDKGVERWERWRSGAALGAVAGPAKAGAQRVRIDAAAKAALKPGMRVLMVWQSPSDRSLLLAMAGHPSMSGYDWGKATGMTEQREWPWPVEITAIEGDEAVLAQALRMDVRPEWQVTFRQPDGLLREAGIEKLSIATRRGGDSPHNTYPGWNGIYLNRCMDCFVRDVEIDNSDNGVIHSAAKNTTVSGLRITGGAHHHATALRAHSHDNLIERFVIESKPMHGINTENLASGNVWRKGRMLHGTFDSHRAMSFDLVRTDIEVNNDGKPGGAGSAGPFAGRRFAHWNVRITGGSGIYINHPDQFPLGALVGIQGPRHSGDLFAMLAGDKGTISVGEGRVPSPPDLYEAQLAARLADRPPVGLPGSDSAKDGRSAKDGKDAKDPKAKPAAKAAAAASTVKPEVQAVWNKRLADGLRAALGKGRQIRVPVKVLGGDADVEAVDAKGGVQFRTGRGSMTLGLASLEATTRAGLAHAIAADDPACAAFHVLAAGNTAAGDLLLGKAGAAAAEVRTALGRE